MCGCEKDSDVDINNSRVDNSDPTDSQDVIWLPGEPVWWMRDTQFGVQRVQAEVFCRLPMKIRIKVRTAVGEMLKDVLSTKLLKREASGETQAEKIKLSRYIRENSRPNRTKYYKKKIEQDQFE